MRKGSHSNAGGSDPAAVVAVVQRQLAGKTGWIGMLPHAEGWALGLVASLGAGGGILGDLTLRLNPNGWVPSLGLGKLGRLSRPPRVT